MIDAASQLRVHAYQPGAASFVRMLIEPVTAVGVLLAAAAWLAGGIDAPHVILALLVFALTFPGQPFRGEPRFGKLAVDLVTGWGALVVLLLLLGWATGTLAAFDRRALLVWVVATPLALLAAHLLVPALLRRVLAADGVQRTAVIAGANDMGRTLAQRIGSNPYLGVRFAGYFDDRQGERVAGLERRLGTLAELPDYVRTHGINVIYCALPMCSQPRIMRLLEDLHDTTASIYFVPDLRLFDLIQARVDTIGGVPVVALCESPYFGINAVVKRLFDLVVASAILVAISPLMFVIAAGVKCSSTGPVLFKQRRYGSDGREITVYKFRTMTCLEDGDVVRQAQREDPRVTRFGALLRKYSLDELPQFINVLQGRMSVVGPRPHAVAHNEMYRRQIRGYMMRHKVKPGITGLAQIKGFRGETETVDKMRLRVEHDLDYLRNWSPLLDFKILCLTVGAVIGDKNAY